MKNVKKQNVKLAVHDSRGTVERRAGYTDYRCDRPFNYDFGDQRAQVNYECGRTQAILVKKLLGHVPHWSADQTLGAMLLSRGVSVMAMNAKVFMENNRYFYSQAAR
jgi:hypothetical protein